MSLLAEIAVRRRADIAGRLPDEPVGQLRRQAKRLPPVRDFIAALRRRTAAGQTAVIAEIKFASPSAGDIRPASATAVADIARAYAAAGAACLSVLTEPQRFKGNFSYLDVARKACDLPIVCKDFVVSPWQIWKARNCGADAILLIVAMLPGEELLALADQAQQAGLAILAEVHTAEELHWLLAQPQLNQAMVGINNRDLHSLKVSLSVTEKLAPAVPANRLCVSESGISQPDDIAAVARYGVLSVLVGESLMKDGQSGRKLSSLLTR